MKKYIDKAYITDKDGNKRKLVADTKIYPPIKARKEIKRLPVSPIGVFRHNTCIDNDYMCVGNKME